MKTPIQFLAKFILASAVIYFLWTPLSKAYFTLLSIEANATFALLDHDARLVVDHQGVYIFYPDIFPPFRNKRDIKIPIEQSIAIHFNIIVIVALFAATRRMPWQEKIKGVAVGIALLSILHTAHVYFVSHIFIWEYIDLARWPVEISADHITRLIRNVEHHFPRSAQPYIVWFHDYWSHFLDEGAPLLIWLYFALSYLTGKERSVTNQTISRQMRRRAVREK